MNKLLEHMGRKLRWNIDNLNELISLGLIEIEDIVEAFETELQEDSELFEEYNSLDMQYKQSLALELVSDEALNTMIKNKRFKILGK